MVRLPNWPDEAVEVAVAVLSKWRDGLRRRCGVNADALPLGLAPHKLVQTSPDGVEQIAGRFLSADLAEGTAEFLRQVSPQDTLHGDPGNAGAARSEGTGMTYSLRSRAVRMVAGSEIEHNHLGPIRLTVVRSLIKKFGNTLHSELNLDSFFAAHPF